MTSQTSTGTEFEKPRGVSQVEVRKGYAQVHVTGLPSPLPESRLMVLRSVADAKISLDFLKLTQDGLSFLVPEGLSETAESVLRQAAVQVAMQPNCSIVLIHAVNIRDEEGLISRLVSIANHENVPVEHLSDMHDRLLLVTDSAQAERLAAVYRKELLGEAA